MKEILFVSHKFPPSTGGMEKHCYELYTYLKSRFLVRTIFYEQQENKLLFYIKLRHSIRNQLKKNGNISMIYFNDLFLSIFGLGIGKKYGIPTIATVHGLDVVYPNFFYQKIIKYTFSNLEMIVCVSKNTEDLCKLRGAKSNQLCIINNGIDHEMAIPESGNMDELIQRYNLPKKGTRILFSLGRPMRRKGFSWFVSEVLPKLDENIILVLAGSNKMLSQNKGNVFTKTYQFTLRKWNSLFGYFTDYELAKTLDFEHVRSRVFHLGKIPFRDLKIFLQKAELFIMPNIAVKGDVEGFGLVALEAAISGTTVLASKIDGIPDAIIDKKNGYLIPPQKSEIWVNKIHSLLKDDLHLGTFGNKAKSFTIKHFSWEKMGRKYEDLILSIAK